MQSIWNWMKEASILPQENSQRNEELFELILEASLDSIRHWLNVKGNFIEPLGAVINVSHVLNPLSSNTDVDNTSQA
jgi:hypothetical protein